jgi:predicted SAM-dependent methyltransferase
MPPASLDQMRPGGIVCVAVSEGPEPRERLPTKLATRARTRIVAMIRRSRSPVFFHAGKTLQFSLLGLRRIWWRARRRAIIQRYLDSDGLKKLELATGQFPTPGWLNTDLDPRFARASNLGGGVIFLDATRRFPFADGTFDYIFSEHMIEHVSYDDARSMLCECARVLRRGGRIRLATPDLAQLLALYDDRSHLSADQAAYVRWIAAEVLGDVTRATPQFVLNTYFREWDHIFLFDEETLRTILVESGFTNVQRCRVGKSDDPELTGRERMARCSPTLSTSSRRWFWRPKRQRSHLCLLASPGPKCLVP